MTLYERTLSLLQEGDIEHAEVSLELAEALQITGAFDRSRDLLERCIAELEDGDVLVRADAMMTLSMVLAYTEGAEASRAPLQDAIELLETQPPGRHLARAYTEMASQFAVEGSAEGVDWAERALALVDRFDLPAQRVSALVARGLAQFYAGNPTSLEDFRSAIELGQREGLGRPVALAFNNLATLALPSEGPQAAIELCREGIEICQRRGLDELRLGLRSTMLPALYDAGEWDAVVSQGELDLGDAEARSDLWVLVEIGAFRARVLTARGLDHRIEHYLEGARSLGFTQTLVLNLTVAAVARLSGGDELGARELLREIMFGEDVAILNVADHLAELARVAAGVGDTDSFEKFLTRAPRAFSRHRLGHTSAEAILAEVRGNLPVACATYQGVADEWERSGCVVEHAHALFGVYRCASALGLTDEAILARLAAESVVESLDAPFFTWIMGPREEPGAQPPSVVDL